MERERPLVGRDDPDVRERVLDGGVEQHAGDEAEHRGRRREPLLAAAPADLRDAGAGAQARDADADAEEDAADEVGGAEERHDAGDEVPASATPSAAARPYPIDATPMAVKANFITFVSRSVSMPMTRE